MNNLLHEELRRMFCERFHIDIADVSTDLIESGLLDSQGFVELLLILEQAYGVRLNLDELELDYFRSIHSIADLIATMNPAVVAKAASGDPTNGEEREAARLKAS